MLVTKDNIDAAIVLIERGPDGSKVNDQARQQAKHLLLAASQLFGDFAELKPGSLPARYLHEQAAEFRRIAAKVGLPK